MPLTATLSVGVDATSTGSLDIERLTSVIQKVWRMPLVDGAGAGQASKLFSDTRSLAGGAADSLDLAGSTLKDAFGFNLVLTKIKAILIVSDPTNTTALTIGNSNNGIAAPFGAPTHSITIPPGGMFLIATPDVDGFPVVNTTADLLRVANAAGANANYDLVVIGV